MSCEFSQNLDEKSKVFGDVNTLLVLCSCKMMHSAVERLGLFAANLIRPVHKPGNLFWVSQFQYLFMVMPLELIFSFLITWAHFVYAQVQFFFISGAVCIPGLQHLSNMRCTQHSSLIVRIKCLTSAFDVHQYVGPEGLAFVNIWWGEERFPLNEVFSEFWLSVTQLHAETP